MHCLEAAHLSAAKQIQGLPPNAANIAVLPTLQLWSINSILAFKRLTMLWHILSLPMTSVYKVIVITIFMWLETLPREKSNMYKGPVGLMFQTTVEFGLNHYVRVAMTSGIYSSMLIWKRRIKYVLWEREKYLFSSQTIMYRHSQLYADCIVVGQLWAWWRFCKFKPTYTRKCKVILRIVSGNHVMRQRRCKPGTSAFCQDCCDMVDDSVQHMLFECSGLSECRQHAWQHVLNNSPQALAKQLECMSNICKTHLILCGYGSYVNEWCDLYIVTCNFVCDMYALKLRKYNHMV